MRIIFKSTIYFNARNFEFNCKISNYNGMLNLFQLVTIPKLPRNPPLIFTQQTSIFQLWIPTGKLTEARLLLNRTLILSLAARCYLDIPDVSSLPVPVTAF